MRSFVQIYSCVLILLLANSMSSLARPQQPAPPPRSEEKEKKPGKESEKNPDEDASWPRTPETMEYEIQYRAAIELRQSERRKALEAAEQIVTLARRLRESAAGRERVSVSDTLETIQKQAKRIRSLSGGGESDPVIENWPADLEAGAEQILALAESLKQQLESLDHRVISLTIINGSTSIIRLADYLREHFRSAGS